MILQTIEYGFFREITVLLRFFVIFLLFYMAFQTGKRAKEATKLSSTMGLTFFIMSAGLMHLINTIRYFYVDSSHDLLLSNVASLSHLVGMILFIFFVELDYTLHKPIQNKNGFYYKLTVISVLLTIILFPISFYFLENASIVFVAIVFPFIIAFIALIRQFKALEMVKRRKILPWFAIGIPLIGFSTFLNAPYFWMILDNWASILNTLCKLIGVAMVTYAWLRLPSLSELDWLQKMERFFIIHLESSGVLYQYSFQKTDELENSEHVDGNLAGTAIGGINTLLGAILNSGGHIKQIDHGGKKVLFTQGIKAASILIAKGDSDELRYRLELFHSMFERQFGEKLRAFNGDITPFRKINDLLIKIFLK